MDMTRLLVLPLLLVSAVFGGCTGIPDNVTPVEGFELPRYLGTWYEVARLDHSFERGLSKVTATYSMREDGGVRVVNRGFNAEKGEWKEAVGKAYFIDREDVGRLKVSFFGPFYGGYNIMELDTAGYQYALICGPDTSYLWILARKPVLDEAIYDRLVAHAARKGFDTKALIRVQH